MAIDSAHQVGQNHEIYCLQTTDSYIQGFQDKLIKPENLTTFQETNKTISEIVTKHLEFIRSQNCYDRATALLSKVSVLVLGTVFIASTVAIVGVGFATLGTIAKVCLIVGIMFFTYGFAQGWLKGTSMVAPKEHNWKSPKVHWYDFDVRDLYADNNPKKNNETIMAITEVIRKLQIEVTYLTTSLNNSDIGKGPIRDNLQTRLSAIDTMRESQQKMLEVFNFILSSGKKPNTN